MRVSFRWSRGALATKLRRSSAGWVVRVPAGTKAGTISVRVTDRAGRRSRVIRLVVLPAPVVRAPATVGGPLPARVPRQRHVDLAGAEEQRRRRRSRSASQARAAGIATVFVKSSDGRSRRGRSSTRRSSPRCAPRACTCARGSSSTATTRSARPPRARRPSRPAPTASSSTPRPRYEGKYAQAQQYVTALRTAIGPALPARPDVVPVRRLPPAPAVLGLPRRRAPRRQPAAGLLEGDRRDRRRGEREDPGPQPPLRRADRAARARPTSRRRRPTSSASARSGRPTAPAGCRGGAGRRRPSRVGRRSPPRRPRRVPLPDPGWPALDTGSKGDEVDLAAGAPRVASRRRSPSTATFGTATAAGAGGVPAVARPARRPAETDPATWQAVLTLPVTPVDWVARAAAG